MAKTNLQTNLQIAFIAAIGSLTWGYGQFCGSSTVSQPYFIAKFFTDPSTEAALIDGILGALVSRKSLLRTGVIKI